MYGRNSDISLPSLIAILSIFLRGWCLTRGANLQKYRLKRGIDEVHSDGQGAFFCTSIGGMGRTENNSRIKGAIAL
eukprot:SAG31_NODE_18482_length_634_cov_1.887850_1_plen_75_part_01